MDKQDPSDRMLFGASSDELKRLRALLRQADGTADDATPPLRAVKAKPTTNQALRDKRRHLEKKRQKNRRLRKQARRNRHK